MTPQVKAPLQAFADHFSDFEEDDDFIGEDNNEMCYEIEDDTSNGGVIGRTLVYSGTNKYGNPMVRDNGEFEINSNGEILKCDGLSMDICNSISTRGLEIYEEEH